MKCPLCHLFFGIETITITFTNHVFMSNHLRQVHYLHSSCDVIARAMFQSPAGYKEAVEVLKDFEMRDQKYRNLQFSKHKSLFLPSKLLATTTTCDQIVQTEEIVIKEEENVVESSRNVDLKSKEEKFEEYWEEGKFLQSSYQNSAFTTLTEEENEIFDKLEEILESRNKEIASLESKLILSKESEGFVCKEIEKLKNMLEELERNISINRSTNEAKDLEINTLKAKIKDCTATERALTETLAAANRLLDDNEKKGKAVEERKKEEKDMQVLLNDSRKSLNDLLEINTITKNKVVEAVMNTKIACKFMVGEVTKKFEEFEVELDSMNESCVIDGIPDYNENVKVKNPRNVDYVSEESTHIEEPMYNKEHSHVLKRK